MPSHYESEPPNTRALKVLEDVWARWYFTRRLHIGIFPVNSRLCGKILTYFATYNGLSKTWHDNLEEHMRYIVFSQTILRAHDAVKYVDHQVATLPRFPDDAPDHYESKLSPKYKKLWDIFRKRLASSLWGSFLRTFVFVVHTTWQLYLRKNIHMNI